MTIRLPAALRAWPSAAFAATLKGEIEALPAAALPLAQGTAHGGHVGDEALTATVLRAADTGAAIEATVGVFFAEIIAGCSCGDEPQSVNAYCELRVRIDRSGAASFAVVPE